MQTVKVIANRPADIPGDWTIYNAPRPLYGDRTWQGDFFHGVFYAAVDPAGEEAARFTQRNVELDAWPLEYVTDDQVIQEQVAYYQVNLPKVAAKIDPADPEQRRMLVSAWLNRQRR